MEADCPFWTPLATCGRLAGAGEARSWHVVPPLVKTINWRLMMTDVNRRALIKGSTAVATAGALAGPALLEWAKAWAQTASWKPEQRAQLSMLRWKYFVQAEDDEFVRLMDA